MEYSGYRLPPNSLVVFIECWNNSRKLGLILDRNNIDSHRLHDISTPDLHSTYYYFNNFNYIAGYTVSACVMFETESNIFRLLFRYVPAARVLGGYGKRHSGYLDQYTGSP